MITENEFTVFKELFDTYYHSLLIYAYQKVNDRAVAEDMVQEVFLSLWTHREQIDFDIPLRGYLFRAVHNQCVNYLQSRHFALAVDRNEASVLLHREIVEYNQHDTLLLKELADEIFFFIDTLPEQCRKVFKLSRQDGLKNKEIAALLGISEKTVESHIGKALKDLRAYLLKVGLLGLLSFLFIRSLLKFFHLF